MPDYVNYNSYLYTRYLWYLVTRRKEYQASRKKKRQGKREKHARQKTKGSIYMRSGSRPSPDGTRLLFAGGTVSPMMCPADGHCNIRTTKKAGRKTSREEGRDEKTRTNVTSY